MPPTTQLVKCQSCGATLGVVVKEGLQINGVILPRTVTLLCCGCKAKRVWKSGK